MGEIEAKVAAHYTPGDLHGRILAGLEATGRDIDALRPDDLKPFEPLHLGGWQATEHVVDELGVVLEREVDLLQASLDLPGDGSEVASAHVGADVDPPGGPFVLDVVRGGSQRDRRDVTEADPAAARGVDQDGAHVLDALA